MKYSDSNTPVKCIMTNSVCYKSETRRLTDIKGVLWHSTGANNTSLKRYVQPSEDDPNYNELIALLGKNTAGNDWNHSSREAGVHYFIGKLANGTVSTVQTLPLEYRPWGCGKGSTGLSCNDGWLQFEICEGNLSDKTYFDQIYREACELTAYLCKKYNLNPKGTSRFNGKDVPVLTTHAEAHSYNFASNHSDILHWFKAQGKTMEDMRSDVDAILNPKVEKETYRVRKSWTDSKSQVGAYSVLENAIKACQQAGPEYEVYNKAGQVVYSNPIEEKKNILTKGDTFRLKNNAVYSNGRTIPKYIINTYPLYIRTDIKEDGTFVFSTLSSGAVTGTINVDQIMTEAVAQKPVFQPYVIVVDTALLNVRTGPGTKYNVITIIKKGSKYTIEKENNGWGKLKNQEAWISLNYTKKV